MLSSLLGRKKATMVDSADALPGRDDPSFEIPSRHAVLDTPLRPPFPAGIESAYFALGCFWGAERLFWEIDGVYSTAVGYQGGFTPNPTYEEVCTGRTGHTESVLVAFDPLQVSYQQLLKTFFEEHDPTQGMRQGADVGTQYRSAVFTTSEDQRSAAEMVRGEYATRLGQAGFSEVTTEVEPAGPFYYAEEYHQQYLHKHPNGYCGLAGTGVSCPVPWASISSSTENNMTEPDQLPNTETEWRKRLTPEQFHVLREAGTERPFTGEYVDTKADGTYHCAGCGNLLFESGSKFDSGSGWPSFTEARPGSIELLEDRSHGMVRTEVRCAQCESHLGHLFNDGPRERGGQRFCMNSCSLDLNEI